MSEAKTTSPKTLAQMTAEVVENNTAKGWYENCATFPEAMAMLHSEVSEALEAWRKHGSGMTSPAVGSVHTAWVWSQL